jgi:hypothetical protein
MKAKNDEKDDAKDQATSTAAAAGAGPAIDGEVDGVQTPNPISDASQMEKPSKGEK